MTLLVPEGAAAQGAEPEGTIEKHFPLTLDNAFMVMSEKTHEVLPCGGRRSVLGPHEPMGVPPQHS